MDSLISRGPARVLLAVAALCSVILLIPWPGSLSVVVSRSLSAGAGTPAGELLSEVPLLLLAAATAAAAARAWFRTPGRRRAVAGGVIGVALAYAVSETLKLLLAQPRPCAGWALPVECPPAGDWSLPSNHATLAFAAVVMIAVVTRSVWATLAAALAAALVATGRMVEGMHYLHDVALGALVGGGVTIAAVIVTSRMLGLRDAGRMVVDQ